MKDLKKMNPKLLIEMPLHKMKICITTPHEVRQLFWVFYKGTIKKSIQLLKKSLKF